MANDSGKSVVLWLLIIVSLLANAYLIFVKVPGINREGRELTAYLANTTIGPPPDLQEFFYKWVTNTDKRVDRLWDEARNQGWPIAEPEHHIAPPPPPPW